MKVFRLVVVALALLAHGRLPGAINPEGYKRIGSDVVKLRELARVVEADNDQKPTRRRITIVGEVVEVARTSRSADAPRVIVIDYTVDLAARDAAAAKYREETGSRPGPQFMYEPDAPTLDANKEFWAHLAPVAGRLGNVNRYAGSVVNFRPGDFSGPVFVPVAGQYSWDEVTLPSTTAAPGAPAVDTFTGTLRTGIMAIGSETTGTILETESGTYELDFAGNAEAGAAREKLAGKKVVVTGIYQPRPGVEVKQRRIVKVQALRAAK